MPSTTAEGAVTDQIARPHAPARPLGRYIPGLALIALLVVGSSFLTSAALSRQALDAAVINVAANQIVLSQRIGEAVSTLADSPSSEQAVLSLQTSLAELEASHRGLQFGDETRDLPESSEAIQALYVALEPRFAALKLQITGLLGDLEGSGFIDGAQVASMIRAADLYETAMETIVFSYQSEAEQRVETLRKRQYVMLSATLLLLILEGLFLFRPAARRLQESWQAQSEAHASARQEDQLKLNFLARYDPLTGLINRTLFSDRLSSAVARARRDGGIVSLMFLDVDHFKAVNDRYGHATGDALLEQVADRLRASVRESDTVARLGGDEFTVILEGAHRVEDVGRVATKILSSLREPYRIGHRELHVTASIGISIYPLDGSDADEMLKDADIAMYSAKAAGRNTYQYFTPELRDKTTERLHLIDGLRRAIERSEGLALVYQPKYDTRAGLVTGVEALVRWDHPELGRILPARFIPLAEETDLIIPLGEWVLRTAVHQMREWLDMGFSSLTMSINVSSRQFRQGNLVEAVEAALNEAGLPPEYLEIELTEGTLVEDTELVRRTLERLRAMGVKVSIDDFGTGYSSLGYLKSFPIDTLKIDRSFVSDVTGDSDDAAISAAIVGLARALRLHVIAEGVETVEQREFLSAIGCHHIQGYLISRPIPPTELADFVVDAKAASYVEEATA